MLTIGVAAHLIVIRCSSVQPCFWGVVLSFETLHYLAKTLVKIDVLDKIWNVHHNAYYITACVLHQVAVGPFASESLFPFIIGNENCNDLFLVLS